MDACRQFRCLLILLACFACAANPAHAQAPLTGPQPIGQSPQPGSQYPPAYQNNWPPAQVGTAIVPPHHTLHHNDPTQAGPPTNMPVQQFASQDIHVGRGEPVFTAPPIRGPVQEFDPGYTPLPPPAYSGPAMQFSYAGQPEPPLSSDQLWLRENRGRLERLMETTNEQDAPGADYPPEEYDELPDYVYEAYYYDTPFLGARPLADYSVPGYEARDQQEGPGEPEFERVLPPARISEIDRESLVVRGIMPGSFLAPGTNTSVRLRGFVRLAALYDFDPIGVPDAFVTNTIPVPHQNGKNFNMSGRISRFALETWTPTNYCDWNVHTFIEGDFFNGPGQAAGGGGNPFRLRHAFFDFGYFRFGQQNTTFMDATSWPSLVDFQGPNSWVNQRQPSARITLPLTERFYWAASLERCFSDITTNGLGVAVQDVPDFATHVRFESDLGHFQVGGLLRTIGYRPTGGVVTRQLGSGLSGSLVFHPWAIALGTNPVRDEHRSGLTRSRILLQATWGSGVGRFMNDLAGQGLDGQVDPITGQFQLVGATGWNASYEHWFNEYWLANLTYSNVNVDSNVNQPGGTYDGAQYLAASVWWVPFSGMSFGVELIWGERENLSGIAADAQRLHALAQYNF